jgi:hypothetical protein
VVYRNITPKINQSVLDSPDPSTMP